jgi:hypothetical protein
LLERLTWPINQERALCLELWRNGEHLVPTQAQQKT